MQSALRQCIAISRSFLPPGYVPLRCLPTNNDDVAAVTAVRDSGLTLVNHPGIPRALAAQLYEAAQTQFRNGCNALLATDRPPAMQPMKDVVVQLRASFQSLYQRKLVSAAETLKASRLRAKEKQPYSTDILIYAFQQSQSPTKREREVLSSLTGLSMEQVRVWFQNRRQRTKKRAPEVQPRTVLQLEDVLARVAAWCKAADEDFEDDDGGHYSCSDRDRSVTYRYSSIPPSLTVPATTSRSYPAVYMQQDLSPVFHCEPPLFRRVAATHPPAHAQAISISELTRSMSRLTLRQRRQISRSSTGSTTSTICTPSAPKSSTKNKVVANSNNSVPSATGAPTRKKAVRKDPETGRKVAGRRTASAASATSPALSSSTSPPPAPAAPCVSPDAPTVPRKRLGPLRRKPAGKALARQASESSVASTSSSDSSRSTSYSSDFSLASDSSFTSVESAPTAASMDCFQPQQQPQFDPLAAFDFTQLFSSQPSDPLPQPVADFELPPDLLAGLQMPMDTAALPPPESTDFLALLNDPTIQDLLQSVQDMDVVAPQQAEQSFTFDNTLNVGSADTSAFLDLSASTLPTFDAMFGLDASSFQDTLWNSPGFSLPITV